MNVQVVLADTGRPVPGGQTLNLLNAGWTGTHAIPLPDGGFTLPHQAIAIFVHAEWNDLNRPHQVLIELLDDEAQPAQILGPEGLEPVRIDGQMQIPSVPTAPNGTPGLGTAFFEWPPGMLRIEEARRRYLWRVTVGESSGEAGFWVQPLPPGVTVG